MEEILDIEAERQKEGQIEYWQVTVNPVDVTGRTSKGFLILKMQDTIVDKRFANRDLADVMFHTYVKNKEKLDLENLNIGHSYLKIDLVHSITDKETGEDVKFEMLFSAYIEK